MTVPGAPTVGIATAGDHAAIVRWAPPADDGGDPPDAYIITAEPAGVAITVPADRTSARVSRLRNGEEARFTVAAVNDAGPGAASASAFVVPRAAAELVALTSPVPRVAYGTTTAVTAALVRPDGSGVARQRVDLLARVRPATRWRLMSSATTGTGGRAVLRARLPASADLRVHHPPEVVAQRTLDLPRVAVSKRITARVSRTQTRLGTPLLVGGSVAPVQSPGTPVYLQRRLSSGVWRRLASGRMTTGGRYAIRWSATNVGRYPLRVVVPSYKARAAGATAGWWHRVDPEIAADIAGDILRNPRITLAEIHLSAGSDRATAWRNLADVAGGRLARTSCYGGAPCRSTALDRRVLRAVRDMGRRATITVSELAGGIHAGRSAHYRGRAVDITWVGGRHVGSGANHQWVADVCRRYGADQVFTPTRDPWGGHSRHVHCGWDTAG